MTHSPELSYAIRMKRARNYRMAFALHYRVHTSLDNPATDRIVQTVMGEEKEPDGYTPVHERIEALTRAILERMHKEAPTRELKKGR